MARIRPQSYPRINDPDDKYDGYLDDSQLVPHTYKIPEDGLKQLIITSIENANQKSSREMLSIDAELPKETLIELLQAAGRDLFKYFKKYPGDPASTAHQVYRQHYRKVAREQFRNQLLQKERMNSGWRYPFLAVGCARESRRFVGVSDIGAAEADFNLLSPDGGLVVDPFAGSGTTGIAALQNQRNCVLIDNNEEYHLASIQRLRSEADFVSTNGHHDSEDLEEPDQSQLL